MTLRYLGDLPREDPLYDYLCSQIAPQQGGAVPDACYRVLQFSDSRDVYLYEEGRSGARLVGKFFRSSDQEQARRKGETEFNNLLFLRDLGFSALPHYVVKPYGFNHSIDNVLVVEYLEGKPLSVILHRAIHRGQGDRLHRKLADLAHFLAALHHRTAGDWTVDFDESHRYLGRLLKSLRDKRGLGHEWSEWFHSLGEQWRCRDCMWEDRAVLVHGDATPANLLFGNDGEVMAIDLERMKWADRVFDLGRLCGELKHAFFRATGHAQTAEPFIGRFLWEYAGCFPDRQSAFHAITRRIPFYMGITLLRIARNSWIDRDYRWRLIREAKVILRGSP